MHTLCRRKSATICTCTNELPTNIHSPYSIHQSMMLDASTKSQFPFFLNLQFGLSFIWNRIYSIRIMSTRWRHSISSIATIFLWIQNRNGTNASVKCQTEYTNLVDLNDWGGLMWNESKEPQNSFHWASITFTHTIHKIRLALETKINVRGCGKVNTRNPFTYK